VPPPVAKFSYTCKSSTVVLNGSLSKYETQYQWLLPGGQTGWYTNPSLSRPKASVNGQLVTLKVRGPGGTSDWYAKTVNCQ